MQKNKECRTLGGECRRERIKISKVIRVVQASNKVALAGDNTEKI